MYRDDRGSEKLIGNRTWGFKVGTMLNFFFLPFVIVFGWIGNATSLAVFSRPKNRSISCCVYMCGLSISDSLMMTVASHYLIRFTYYYIFSDKHTKAYTVPVWECKTFTWLYQLASLNGACIIVCMTVDRLIGVRFPLLAKRLCTASKAQKMLLVILLLTGVFTTPHLLHSKVI
ncbi:hypothetical protein CAPTEDRAFT_107840, partial [Capitella teleta]